MSSDKKSKDALTTLVGIALFVCFMSLESGAAVIGKPILNTDITDFPTVPIPSPAVLVNGPLHNQIRNVPQLSISGILSSEVIDTSADDNHQLRKLTFTKPGAEKDKNGRLSEATHSIRQKRSPYPPGFVAWAWREPCICPPGQVFSCRCFNTLVNASASSEEKPRRRRSRSRKLKSKTKD